MHPLTLLEQRSIEARVLVPMIRAFEKAFGREEAHRVVRGVIGELARKTGEEIASSCGEVEPLDRVRAVLPKFQADDALEISVQRDDGDRYDFDVTRCRFAEMYRELGAEDLGFLLSCGRDFALTEGLDPSLTLRREQTLMEGCSHCDFRFRQAPGAANSERPEKQDS